MPSQYDVCLLSTSHIAGDPRIKKQGNLLVAAGLSVIGVGMPGPAAVNPSWPILEADFMQPRNNLEMAPYVLKKNFHRAVRPLAWLSTDLAETIYWGTPAFAELNRRASEISACVYVANDWTTMPIADRLARVNRTSWVYDSHEYVRDQLAESLLWCIFSRGLAINIEKKFIGRSRFVSTVSSGIARCLAEDHRLCEQPMVVRNVPEAVPDVNVRSRLPDGRIRILYHGAITPFRKLHEVVKSVTHWPTCVNFVMRGPVSKQYEHYLRNEIESRSLQGRCSIEPPVAQSHIISAAADYDIGLVALPNTSRQYHFALPNKLFEYIHAGLGLLVPDLCEVRSLVENYKNGYTYRRLDPEGIAEAVNKLEESTIASWKKQSLIAASSLRWHEEAQSWARRIVTLVHAS